MTYILINDCFLILYEWADYVLRFAKDGDEIFIIHCNGFKKNDDDIITELNTSCSYLKARNKETLFRHLSENISKNQDYVIIADIDIFFDTGLTYEEFSFVKVINELSNTVEMKEIKIFIYGEKLVKSFLSTALNPSFESFKNIEEIFS